MFDISADEELLNSSIVQVNNTQGNKFGTGFIVGKDAQYIYVLTCAHVLEALGGQEFIKIRGRNIEIEQAGEGNGLDLAVLKTVCLPTDKSLALKFEDSTEREVIAIGYSKYGEHRSRSSLIGTIGDRFPLENNLGTVSMYVWDFEITRSDRNVLDSGFSGSPVFEKSSGDVIGVVVYKSSDTRGAVICMNNIYKIWPKPLLGNVSPNRIAYLREETYLSGASKETLEELRYLKKKERLAKELTGKKGQKKMALLCNFADDLLYQISRIKNQSEYDQHLINEMYSEVRDRLLEALRTQRHSRALLGMAKLLFEEEGYNETEALRYCNEAIEMDKTISDAHFMRISICRNLEKNGYQQGSMRDYIQDSIKQLLALRKLVSQEIRNEYLPAPRRSPRRGSSGGAGGPERGPEGAGPPA